MHRGGFFLYRYHIVVDEALGCSPAHVHAAAIHGAGTHKQHVRAEGGNLFLSLVLRPLSHAHHGDDRTHADDDAQHGEAGAQLVARQSPHRDPNYCQ